MYYNHFFKKIVLLKYNLLTVELSKFQTFLDLWNLDLAPQFRYLSFKSVYTN